MLPTYSTTTALPAHHYTRWGMVRLYATHPELYSPTPTTPPVAGMRPGSFRPARVPAHLAPSHPRESRFRFAPPGQADRGRQCSTVQKWTAGPRTAGRLSASKRLFSWPLLAAQPVENHSVQGKLAVGVLTCGNKV
jgi:hypothetical protein